RLALGPLLPGAGGINREVGNAAALGILVPLPAGRRAEDHPLPQRLRDALPHIFGGALDGGFGQAYPCRLEKQVRATREAGADGAGQGRQAFDPRGQLARRDASLLIEGGQPFAAQTAVVAGAPVVKGAHQTDESALAVYVVASGLLAVGTGH